MKKLTGNQTIWIKNLAFTGVGILLFWLVLRSVDFNGLLGKLSAIPTHYYIAIQAFTTLTHFSRALRWRLMLQSTGHSPKLWNTVLATMSAYFVNQGLPRVGEVTRCTVVADTDKVPLQTSIGTVIAERATDVLCMLLISGTILLFNLGILYDFVYKNMYQPLANRYEHHTTPMVGLAVVGIILLLAFAYWWRGYYRKHKEGKLSAIIKGLVDGLLSVFRLKKQGAFLGHTAFIWFMYFVMTWYWFDAFESTAKLSFGQALFIFAIGNFSRSIPIQAGALPAYIFLVSNALVLLGVDATDAATLVLVIPGIQTLFYIVCGGSCFALYLLVRARLRKV